MLGKCSPLQSLVALCGSSGATTTAPMFSGKETRARVGEGSTSFRQAEPCR